MAKPVHMASLDSWRLGYTLCGKLVRRVETAERPHWITCPICAQINCT